MGSSVLDQLNRFGPDQCEQLSHAEAVAYTRRLASTHYENFSVLSGVLPRRLRDDYANVYAFCRWADDLGDETGDPQRSLNLLAWWGDELDRCYAGSPRHPVFVALRPTIEKHDLPRQPFDDLIDAFVQDQTVLRYDTWAQLLDYCSRSANPVGRLSLYLCGYRDAERQRLSDATCTALQLTNFWQDVRRDVLDRGRVYLPRDVAQAHGLDVDELVAAIRTDAIAQLRHLGSVGDEAAAAARKQWALNGVAEAGSSRQVDRDAAGVSSDARPGMPRRDQQMLTRAYRAALRDAVGRTWSLFTGGRVLWPMLAPDVRPHIRLFTLGGEAVLRKIERGDYRTHWRRPRLSSAAKLMLVGGAMVRSWLANRATAKGAVGVDIGAEDGAVNSSNAGEVGRGVRLASTGGGERRVKDG